MGAFMARSWGGLAGQADLSTALHESRPDQPAAEPELVPEPEPEPEEVVENEQHQRAAGPAQSVSPEDGSSGGWAMLRGLFQSPQTSTPCTTGGMGGLFSGTSSNTQPEVDEAAYRAAGVSQPATKRGAAMRGYPVSSEAVASFSLQAWLSQHQLEQHQACLEAGGMAHLEALLGAGEGHLVELGIHPVGERIRLARAINALEHHLVAAGSRDAIEAMAGEQRAPAPAAQNMSSVERSPASGTTRLGALEVEAYLEEDTVPQWLLCPITMEVMSDPVVAADGHTYERDAIAQWLRAPGNVRSPVTNQPLPGKVLITNHAMRSQIIDLMEARGYVREDAP